MAVAYTMQTNNQLNVSSVCFSVPSAPTPNINMQLNKRDIEAEWGLQAKPERVTSQKRGQEGVGI